MHIGLEPDSDIYQPNRPNLYHQVNQQLLQALEDSYDEELNLGPVFMSFAYSLKLYADYVTKYEVQGALLDVISKRPRVKAFLNACELQKTCKRTPLKRYLSLPLLRIPQYKLMLREVLKHTNAEIAEERLAHAELVEGQKAQRTDSSVKKLRSSQHTPIPPFHL